MEKTFVRIAEKNGVIYLDLGDIEGRAVAVSENGWTVINDPPVKFVRPNGMLALPIPEKEGDIKDLRQFLNVNDDNFILIICWLVGCLRVGFPHPALIIQGEQGAAKSTTVRILRRIFDPNMAPLRSTPKDERDLMIGAENNAVLCFDNISFIKNTLSDSLCRILTGGGFATRELYANRTETIFSLIRPVIMNGIGDLVNRADLLDRSVIVNLSPLKKRRLEASFWQDFDKFHQRILGAILNAASCALKKLAVTAAEFEDFELPRMADFTIWASSAEPALGLPTGEFLDCYTRNRKAIHNTIIDLDLIAGLIVRFVEENIEWSGLPADLLDALKSFADESLVRSRDFPKDPRSLGGRLARIAPNLRARGIEYLPPDRSQRTEKRLIVLKLTEKPGVAISDNQPLVEPFVIPPDIDSPFP